ncbi:MULTISPECIES: TlpA disulfide reductase family protein [Bacillus]|uniref:TlpA disulfide reductase family protein n=1 Tax=Bacillus TaxID=1386 RepID=UPI00031795B0|nr:MULTISPECIES: TlpA disulfide reductase family protein [Bacillus]
MVKKIVAGVILVLLISVALVQAMDRKEEAKLPVVKDNQKAPDFTLENLQGEQVSLSDYKGKKVILNFWATWCGPCREEMPDMEKYYQEAGDSIEILAVNMDTDNDVKGFVENYHLTFPILLDIKDEMSRPYDIISFPTTYFIDEQGIIKEKHIGQMSYETIVEIMGNM